MTTTTVLPWHHASELAYVRDCFFPNHGRASSVSALDIYSAPPPPATDPSSLSSTATVRLRNYEAGLQVTTLWSVRSPRTVPRAVNATADLIRAIVHDHRLSMRRDDRVGRSYDVLDETPLKYVYAMAFLRFVNGFVDRDVSRAAFRTGLSKVHGVREGVEEEDESGKGSVVVKGGGESSMYAHAASIGMPTSFVDLRHRCVHAEIPELWELKRLTEAALEWLWLRWWKVNADGDSGRYVWELDMEREVSEEGSRA